MYDVRHNDDSAPYFDGKLRVSFGFFWSKIVLEVLLARRTGTCHARRGIISWLTMPGIASMRGTVVSLRRH